MTTPKIVIGFHGCTGSGRTTAARQLALRLDARRRSVTDPIIMIADEFGISPLEMTTWKDNAIPWLGGMTPRTFMRLFERGFRRGIGSGFLATRVLDQVQRENDRFTVVDDLQFIAEVDEFTPFDLRGGDNPAGLYTLLIHVIRPGYSDPGDDGDREVALVNPNHFIELIRNDGDVAELHAKVDGLFERLRFGHSVFRTNP